MYSTNLPVPPCLIVDVAKSIAFSIRVIENTDMYTFLCKLYTYVYLRGICDHIGGSTITGFATRFLLGAVDISAV